MNIKIFSILLVVILPVFFTGILDELTFIITALAFLAGAAAIILQKKAMKQQKEDGKKAEESLKEQIKLQKKAIEKQEIIGAWQLLTTKACGNSGKKEAIEFLASRGVPLSGIDLSAETHGGPVYLEGLFKDFTGDRGEIDLTNANFSKAFLFRANFSKTNLIDADFSKADLYKANFSKANLWYTDFSEADLHKANFSNADLFWANFSKTNLAGADFSEADLHEANFSEANLTGADFSEANLSEANFSEACIFYSMGPPYLPTAPQDYEFVIDERVDENDEPIYPKNNSEYRSDYRFIKLVELKI